MLLKLGQHLIEVHNSRRPLDCLTLTLSFDLIFIGGRGIVMDYPCVKFGDFSLRRFGSIESQTDTNDCYTHNNSLIIIRGQCLWCCHHDTSHCESSPGSSDECRPAPAPGGRRPSDQANSNTSPVLSWC